ncbi:MAG: patatin-like phospholipase family protein [Byssovorax cruenta]
MDITLALGGGGAKGNAHIGVIRRLEQEGFRIKGIAGTSFGGIIAVLYAAGYRPNDLEEMFAALDQRKFYGHGPKDGPSLIGIAGVAQLLEDFLGDRTFEQLRMPCVVTATDLKSGTEVLLSKGRLVDAILATIAMPAVFPVRYIGDLELVDGGTLDPVPVAPARSLNPRLPVVAVALHIPMGSSARTWTIPMPIFMPRTLVQWVSRMRYGLMLDVYARSLDLVSRAVAEYRLEVDKPDVIIRPRLGNIDTLDIINVHEVVKIGEAAVDEILPQLKQKFKLHNRIRRALGAKA